MQCRFCGMELPDDARFCGHCGKKLDAEASENLNTDSCTQSGDTDIFASEDYDGTYEDIPTPGEQNTGEQFTNTGNQYSGSYAADTEASARNFSASGRTAPAHERHGNSYPPQSDKKSKGVITALVITITILALAVIAVVLYFTAFNKTVSSSKFLNKASTPAVQTAAPLLTPSPTGAAQLQTYYVVNCDRSISLFESPSASAKTLKDIPLGAAVSYVEPADEGFAKIIYNGLTGYALQSYLSVTPPVITEAPKTDTAANSKPAPPKDSVPQNRPPENGVISNPSYSTYRDSDYSFTCDYPSHFVLYNESNNFVRYSLRAPDNSATLKICATANSSGLSAKTVLANFKSSYPGTVDYENSGDNWCAARTIKDGVCHYGYFRIDQGKIRGFEFHFDQNDFSVYDKYINEIYSSINFN